MGDQTAGHHRQDGAVLADHAAAVEVVEPEHVPRVVPNDADDDQVTAAALIADPDWIVSSDADLLSMGSYQGTCDRRSGGAEQITG